MPPLGGGLMQLIAYGAMDVYLTADSHNDFYFWLKVATMAEAKIPHTTREIYCQDNDLIQEIYMPSNLNALRKIECINNCNLTSIQLPQGLQKFICRKNQMLANLPALPNSLVDFECSGLYLIRALPALPKGLITLSYSDMLLTEQPTLPPQLENLYCYNNEVSSLPVLPLKMKTLHCNKNKLISLPNLPPNLKTLNCCDNQLTSLPTLPPTLSLLYCENNELTSLPILPPTLSSLYCENNELTRLPILPPKLSVLHCSGNPLVELPDLPDSLNNLKWDEGLNLVYPRLKELYNTWYVNQERYDSDDEDEDDDLTEEISEDRRMAWIRYVNNRNERHRRIRVQNRTRRIKAGIMRHYAKRTMAPIHLMPLIDDPTLEVDNFMMGLIDGL